MQKVSCILMFRGTLIYQAHLCATRNLDVVEDDILRDKKDSQQGCYLTSTTKKGKKAEGSFLQ